MVIMLLIFVAGFFHWTVNRVYVPEGHSLLLRYKGPILIGSRQEAEPGHYADEGEIGVLQQLRGPGRHFYCPIWWQRDLIQDVVVSPGEVAVVTSRLGDDLPTGEYLVDGDLGRTTHRGVLRRVFGPGRYRVNTYGYTINIIQTQKQQQGGQEKQSGWVEIPPGYVGVVTNLASHPGLNRPAGIQDDVLPPGLYPINPREQQVDVVEIGYRETSIVVEQQMVNGQTVHDESGEPVAVPESGISFPSNDGFDIQLDFTAIWGIMPEQAADVVRTFGNVEQAEQKVILPQSESICRNSGSKMGAVELLIGETRQQFQDSTTEQFRRVLQEKNVTFLYGLVRHIYIPQQIRIPIQKGYVADELKLTRDQETLTAKTEADLREAEQQVELEAERIRVETTKMEAAVHASGQKEAREIDAETNRLVAELDKQVADLEKLRIVMLGEAEAEAEKLQQEATAQKFDLAVKAFGDPTAYTRWEFAQGLPEQMDLRLFYAGEGTLWTDLKNIMPTLPIANPPATVTAPRPAQATKK